MTNDKNVTKDILEKILINIIYIKMCQIPIKFKKKSNVTWNFRKSYMKHHHINAISGLNNKSKCCLYTFNYYYEYINFPSPLKYAYPS